MIAPRYRVKRLAAGAALGAWWGSLTGLMAWMLAGWDRGLLVESMLAGAALGVIAGAVAARALDSLIARYVEEIALETASRQGWPYNALEAVEPYEAPSMEERWLDIDSEDMVKLWGLVEGIASKLSNRRLNTAVVVVSEEGLPEAAYPDYAPIIIDDYDGDYDYEVSVSVADDWVIVYLRIDVAAALVDALREGDRLEAGDEEILRSAYDIAKGIAMAIGQSEDLAAYSAYKALLKLIKEGYIVAPDSLVAAMPFEPDDVKRRVKEQVRLESEADKPAV